MANTPWISDARMSEQRMEVFVRKSTNIMFDFEWWQELMWSHGSPTNDIDSDAVDVNEFNELKTMINDLSWVESDIENALKKISELRNKT